MPDKTCPLCGGNKCRITPGDAPGCKDYYCSVYDRSFKLHTSVIDSPDKEKLLVLITEFLIQKKSLDFNGQDWAYIFYFNEQNWERNPQYVNTYNLLNTYPQEFMDKASRALLNLSVMFPKYGQGFYKQITHYRAMFEERENSLQDFKGGMYDLLVELGYIRLRNDGKHHAITAEGWKKIDELKKTQKEVNQGFIAMAFKDETHSIREAFRTAIKDSGYAVSIIDEKEHNNQIVPEIFYEIERSKFVVVDVTFPNYGAYYEAGYAQALGKQVIMCCRETEFHSQNNRPHFDVAQKSMIVWKDEEELIERLKKRIEATVK